VLTMSVFASPGTPSSKQCPRVKMAAKSCSITSPWPTMTFCSSSRITCLCCANSCSRSPRLRGLTVDTRRSPSLFQFEAFQITRHWAATSYRKRPACELPRLSIHLICRMMRRQCGTREYAIQTASLSSALFKTVNPKYLIKPVISLL
jgi:hypothetical protein